MKATPTATFFRPQGILAGFHCEHPEPRVPELIHAGEQWFPTDYAIKAHSHHVWELYYQIAGVSLWRSLGQRFELRSHGLFIAPPGIEHELVTRRTGKHHFFFAAVDVQRVFQRYPELRVAFAAKRCRHVPQAEALEGAFRLLMQEITVAAPHRAYAVRTALELVVITAARMLGSETPRRIAMLHPGVAAAKHALEAHPTEPWTLAALGKIARLSPNHLATRFTRELGASPHQYLLAERIRRAKQLLAASDVAVTDLALDLGFSSSQHFAKVFKQLTGSTALAYRKRMAARSSLE